MTVNYIRHLEAVTFQMAEDKRLNSSHVSMYLALFLIWNHSRFQNPLSINRSEVMKVSKIGARATYHKCMSELHSWGYLKYEPSHNPLLGSKIYLFNFGTTDSPLPSQHDGQLESQLPRQVLGPYINSNKHIKQVKQLNVVNGVSSETSQANSKKENFLSPSLDEVKKLFREKLAEKSGDAFANLEAEKFYNHFESNGWLVGGKSKMKNWQAAARN